VRHSRRHEKLAPLDLCSQPAQPLYPKLEGLAFQFLDRLPLVADRPPSAKPSTVLHQDHVPGRTCFSPPHNDPCQSPDILPIARGLPPLAFEKWFAGQGLPQKQSTGRARPPPQQGSTSQISFERCSRSSGWLASVEGLGRQHCGDRHVRTAPKGMLNASGSAAPQQKL